MTTKMEFHPNETVIPEDDMVLYVVGFNPIDIGEHLIEFKSSPLPVFQGVNIENGQEMVPIDNKIEFDFDRDINDAVEYTIITEPVFEYEVVKNKNTLEVIPSTRLALGTNYTIQLFQTKVAYRIDSKEATNKTEPEKIYTLDFKTDEIPLVKEFSPSGTHILASSAVQLEFGKIVDQKNVENKIRFEPETEFTVSWETDSKMIVTPTVPLTKATKYKFVMEAGIEYEKTQTMYDYIFDFETIGYVKVAKFSPGGGSTGQSTALNVTVEFDQEVDHISAQNSFEISPNVAGAFSWATNTMTFNPNGLSYETKYTLKIKSGVVSVNGLDSNEEFSSTFTTQNEITTISVPYYQQYQRYECEILALRMALAYRGVYASTSAVHSRVGVDPTPYNSANNTWGDPDSHFVGDISGASKGYGTNLGPLSRVAQSYGRQTKVGSNWSISQLTTEVSKGNPVIVLAQNGYSTPTNISWHTPGGKYVHAINGTHAYVVVGFKGPASSPTSILLQDPWYRGGSRRWHSISYFSSLWSYHSNSALVVY